MTIQNGKYEARIARTADGDYRVSFGYNDGEQIAAVPGLGIKHYSSEKAAIAAAKRGLAKV